MKESKKGVQVERTRAVLIIILVLALIGCIVSHAVREEQEVVNLTIDGVQVSAEEGSTGVRSSRSETKASVNAASERKAA